MLKAIKLLASISDLNVNLIDMVVEDVMDPVKVLGRVEVGDDVVVDVETWC